MNTGLRHGRSASMTPTRAEAASRAGSPETGETSLSSAIDMCLSVTDQAHQQRLDARTLRREAHDVESLRDERAKQCRAGRAIAAKLEQDRAAVEPDALDARPRLQPLRGAVPVAHGLDPDLRGLGVDRAH